MADAPYRLGAVVYDPKVEKIWREFSAWFGDQGLAVAPRYYETYEDQIEDLLDGTLDAAWNTNLAHVRLLERTAGTASALAMRDTDRGWRSHIVARGDTGFAAVEDLRGRRVGFGDADSPQAHILPVHALRAQGIDPDREFRADRLDRDLGKHGDTGGAEIAQLARVRAGDLDACVVSSVTLDAINRTTSAGEMTPLWTSSPFHHCCFSVLDDTDEVHPSFRRLLFDMDASDPQLCEPMELEYVNRWVPFDPDGYHDLVDAVAAGPIVIGGGDPG